MQRVAVRAQGCVHMSVACTYVGQDVIFLWGGGGIKQPFKKKQDAVKHALQNEPIDTAPGGGEGVFGAFERLPRKEKKKKKNSVSVSISLNFNWR